LTFFPHDAFCTIEATFNVRSLLAMKHLLASAFLLIATLAHASDVKVETVEYRDGETVLQGYLAYDPGQQGQRPGVLVVHEWWGLGEHAKNSARKLAEMGYVGFALDMYGKGKLTTDPAEAGKWAAEFKSNPALAQPRFGAAYDLLKKHPQVDPTKIAAIGYCFGGTIVLEMARAGVDLDGVVSFHGGLKSVLPATARNLQAKVLVCHGAIDPHVPDEEVLAFKEEMTAAKADWQFIAYGNAVHSFTNPEAKGDTTRYEEKAARRSWEAMSDFLREIFASSAP
jgi:dienelactone hydrolase